MRNRGKRLLLLLVVLCCAAFAVYCLWQQRKIDRKPPQITIGQEELRVSVRDPQEKLFEGMTATDAHDGDVTSSLVVESVRYAAADGSFTVTYAAFDAAGNVSKAKRTVCYTDYTAPRFTLSAPLIFQAGSSPDVFAPLGAQDVVDGDLTKRIKGTLISAEKRLPEEGTYTVEFRVSNSLGDTAYLTAPVEMVSGWNSAAKITLKSYLVYLHKGEAFSPESYPVSMKVGGQVLPLDGTSEATVRAQSGVNTSVPGTYHVDYTASYGQHTAHTRLLVVVEE